MSIINLNVINVFENCSDKDMLSTFDSADQLPYNCTSKYWSSDLRKQSTGRVNISCVKMSRQHLRSFCTQLRGNKKEPCCTQASFQTSHSTFTRRYIKIRSNSTETSYIIFIKILISTYKKISCHGVYGHIPSKQLDRFLRNFLCIFGRYGNRS